MANQVLFMVRTLGGKVLRADIDHEIPGGEYRALYDCSVGLLHKSICDVVDVSWFQTHRVGLLAMSQSLRRGWSLPCVVAQEQAPHVGMVDEDDAEIVVGDLSAS